MSSRAVDDLSRIRRFIAQDSIARATSFVTELQAVARKLSDTPRGFPLVPRYEEQGIRRRSWKGYGLLYSVEPDRIFVHRIIGPGQDQDRALGLA